MVPVATLILSSVQERTRVESLALSAAARCVADLTAKGLGISYADAWAMLTAFPVNAADLLNSPHGWALLQEGVALVVSGEPASILPTIH